MVPPNADVVAEVVGEVVEEALLVAEPVVAVVVDQAPEAVPSQESLASQSRRRPSESEKRRSGRPWRN